MATVYSLVCFGGRTGKTVTMTIASPCVVTLTNHGLRAGTGVVFSTTGALPTGVTAGTTYYAKSTAANTFNLYDTAANAIAGGTTGRVNTSGSQSGTHTVKGAYFLSLTSDQLARYGSSGSERIYDGLVAWNTGRAAASMLDEEVCEIGEAFSETATASVTINCPAARAKLTTMVNGSRSAAFHGGVVGAGYALLGTYMYGQHLNLAAKYAEADGFSVYDMVAGYRGTQGISFTGGQTKAKNMIVISNSAPSDNVGIFFSGIDTEAQYCAVIGFGKGIQQYGYTSANFVKNCVLTKNTIGFVPAYSYDARGLTCVNTVSYGNVTTNWGACSGGITFATNNLGGTGEAYTSTGMTRLETTDASPYSALFTDWTNNSLSPPSITAIQVENGVQYYDMPVKDIAGAIIPAYSGSSYGAAVTAGAFVAGLSYTIASIGTTDFTAIGASANTIGVTFKATGAGTGTGTATLNAKHDVGCYEFDLGYGAWPASATIALTDIVSGSRVLITKTSDGSVLYNDVPGTSLSLSTSHIGSFDVVIRKASATPFYREFRASGTTTASQTTTIKCLQQLDE